MLSAFIFSSKLKKLLSSFGKVVNPYKSLSSNKRSEEHINSQTSLDNLVMTLFKNFKVQEKKTASEIMINKRKFESKQYLQKPKSNEFGELISRQLFNLEYSCYLLAGTSDKLFRWIFEDGFVKAYNLFFRNDYEKLKISKPENLELNILRGLDEDV